MEQDNEKQLAEEVQLIIKTYEEQQMGPGKQGLEAYTQCREKEIKME